MRRIGGASLLLLIGLGAFACVLEPVDYTGKTCESTCPDAWRCVSHVCVADTSSATSSSSSGGHCTPLIVPTSFRADWATPNALRWRWDSSGTVDQFGSYRLVVGPSKASVETESGATIFTAQQNPELGKLNLIHTGGVDPVTATITDGLEPATTYFGKLVATDNAGCEHASEVLSATTSVAPSGQVALFVDALSPGEYLLPEAPDGGLPPVVIDPSCPSGSPCIAYTSDCAGESLCYENVRLRLALPGSDITVTAGDFLNLAYLEMRVGTDSNVASYWSEFRLKTDDFYTLPGQTIRADGALRTYQIPLRALVTSSALTYENLTTNGVLEVGAGGLWSDESHVWIDDIYLKW
ncbi:Hypothetical protein A7982_02212 [Minicystis rosea]|nr:Hypothetical protein A7982_02212 [Minicystis rosea]